MAVLQAAIEAADEDEPLFGVEIVDGNIPNPEPSAYFGFGEMRGSLGETKIGPNGCFTDRYTLSTGVKVTRTDGDVAAANTQCWGIVRAGLALWLPKPRLDRSPNPMPDVGVSPALLEGPNGSCLDGVTAVSMALLDLEFWRSTSSA